MTARTLSAFGVVVAIRSEAPDLFELLEPQLPAFPDAGSASPVDVHYHVKVRRDRVAVVRGRRTIGTAPDVPAASMRLVADLQTVMARRAEGYTFVHAGVVAIDGRALLLPAQSHAGKSTLVAALVREGATYGSDEFAVIDAEGRVHPYSRRLALRTPPAVTRIAAADLGGDVLVDGVPVAAVVFTEFTPGASLDLQPMPPGEVVIRMLQHCLGVRGRAVLPTAALRAAAQGAAGFSGPRGDADETARRLVALARQGWPQEQLSCRTTGPTP